VVEYGVRLIGKAQFPFRELAANLLRTWVQQVRSCSPVCSKFMT